MKRRNGRGPTIEKRKGGERGETEIKETRRIHMRKGHGNGRPVDI